MAIPVYIKQNEAGQLRISQDGLYTVFEAELHNCAGLVRLWAHGGGESACLGVMQPWSGGLRLRRRLSALERSAFPDPIEYVSDRETDGEFTENNLHNGIIEADTEREKEQINLHNQEEKNDKQVEDQDRKDLHNINNGQIDQETEAALESLHKSETDLHACPWPAELPEEGLLWYSRPDGSLVSFDGISSLVALPAEPGAKLPRAAERAIEGKKYLVFRY